MTFNPLVGNSILPRPTNIQAPFVRLVPSVFWKIAYFWRSADFSECLLCAKSGRSYIAHVDALQRDVLS